MQVSVLSLLLSLAPATHAPASPHFETLDVDDGLSQLTVQAITQDHLGFMWFGTQHGLNRFDGYNFTVYRMRPGGAGGLSDHFIRDVVVDPEANALWIATGAGGLNRLDLETERVQVFSTRSPDALSHDELWDIELDGEGMLWLASNGGGVIEFDPETGQRRTWVEELPSAKVRALAADANGRLWVGTTFGLAVIDPATGDAQHISLSDGQAGIRAVTVSGGTLWVGTDDTLYAIDPANGRVLSEMTPADGLPDGEIRALMVDRMGMLWVGTSHGLGRYDRGTGRWVVRRHDPSLRSTLAADHVEAIFQSRDGILWFGTWTGGVSKLDESALVFETRGAGGAYGLPSPRVRDFAETQQGVWVATLGGGLARIDGAGSVVEVISSGAGGGLPSSEFHAVEADEAGDLWLGSRDAGVIFYAPESGEHRHYLHRPGDPQSPAGNHVLTLLLDDSDRLWVGTQDNGVSRLDLATGEWRHYTHDPADPSSLSSDTVGVIWQMSDGTLLLGTRGAGFNIYREATDHFYRVRPQGAQGLTHGTITTFAEREDELWVGTQGGGVGRLRGSLADPEQARFEFFDSTQGLGSDAVGTVLVDDTGLVWLSTLKGISRIDPETGQIQNFHPVHGTQVDGYYVGSGLAGSDGYFYFGGLNGLTRFQPGEFDWVGAIEPPVVTSLLVNNQPVTDFGTDSPLSKAAPYASLAEIAHTDRSVGLEFAALHFTEPELIRYRYRLRGYEEDWVETSSARRYATYTNLPAGEYVFEISAAPPNGDWTPAVEQIRLHHLTPPWLSWWAIALYAAALALVGLFAGWMIHREAEHRHTVRRWEDRLRLAMWGSGDVMWHLNLQTGQLEWLDAAALEGGISSITVQNLRDFWRICHPEDREQVRRAMEAHVRGQTPAYEVSYRIRTPEGEWRWALAKGRVVDAAADGTARAVAGATKDVTQLKRTEQALRDLNDRLESIVDERTENLRAANDSLVETLERLTQMQGQLVESEKMASLGGLVAGVAHEINTPLGVAVTAASFIESQTREFSQREPEDLTEETIREFCRTQQRNLEFLQSNLRRASELVRSFKAVAVDQASESRREFEICGYLEEVVSSLRPQYRRSGHEVQLECGGAVQMDSYPGAISQIVTNLVLNALTHAFPGERDGTVHLSATPIGDDRVRIGYSDDGVGCSKEVLQRMFEPFFTTQRGHGGSGLGMHIVYNLVTQVLGGTIQVTSEPGEGMRVEIEFPRIAPAVEVQMETGTWSE